MMRALPGRACRAMLLRHDRPNADPTRAPARPNAGAGARGGDAAGALHRGGAHAPQARHPHRRQGGRRLARAAAAGNGRPNADRTAVPTRPNAEPTGTERRPRKPRQRIRATGGECRWPMAERRSPDAMADGAAHPWRCGGDAFRNAPQGLLPPHRPPRSGHGYSPPLDRMSWRGVPPSWSNSAPIWRARPRSWPSCAASWRRAPPSSSDATCCCARRWPAFRRPRGGQDDGRDRRRQGRLGRGVLAGKERRDGRPLGRGGVLRRDRLQQERGVAPRHFVALEIEGERDRRPGCGGHRQGIDRTGLACGGVRRLLPSGLDIAHPRRLGEGIPCLGDAGRGVEGHRQIRRGGKGADAVREEEGIGVMPGRVGRDHPGGIVGEGGAIGRTGKRGAGAVRPHPEPGCRAGWQGKQGKEHNTRKAAHDVTRHHRAPPRITAHRPGLPWIVRTGAMVSAV